MALLTIFYPPSVSLFPPRRFMSQSLGTKFDHFAETILPTLVTQLPSSAKIMSTAASTGLFDALYKEEMNRLDGVND